MPPLTTGHTPAMSECHSRRKFNRFEAFKFADNSSMQYNNGNHGNKILEERSSKRESLSVSKIWLRGKNDDTNNNSIKTFSFRFPVSRSSPTAAVQGGARDELKAKNGGDGSRRIVSEIDLGRWVNNNGGCDEENQCCNRLEYQPKTPSFARRTLFWLMGRQN